MKRSAPATETTCPQIDIRFLEKSVSTLAMLDELPEAIVLRSMNRTSVPDLGLRQGERRGG